MNWLRNAFCGQHSHFLKFKEGVKFALALDIGETLRIGSVTPKVTCLSEIGFFRLINDCRKSQFLSSSYSILRSSAAIALFNMLISGFFT